MSGDEILVLLGSLALSIAGGYRWYACCLRYRSFGRNTGPRVLAAFAPLFALLALYIVLARWASGDVRNDPIYLGFYLALGAAWLVGLVSLSGFFGFVLRDDWLESTNPATPILGLAVFLGGMASFAGANIGDGPGWWVVLFSAGLATGTWFLSWWLYARISQAMERIVIDRDPGASLRLAGLLVAVGAVTGRAAAGNWQSADATLVDFLQVAFPVPFYVAGFAALERQWRTARLSTSVAVLVLHASFAGLTLYLAGPWH